MKADKIWTKGCLSFWSWNDKLDRDEIKRQLDYFQAAGLSGVFLHARGGLGIDYLGQEWMDAVAVCVEHAKTSGLEIWLYDEDAWPSGFCGGKVPSAGEKHQQKWLSYEMIETDKAMSDKRTVGCYRLNDAKEWEWLQPNEQLAGKESVLRIYYEVNPYYSDLLNPATVRLFIDSTYEAYKQRFSDYFGTIIKGIFTDEPQYAVGKFPWSDALEQQFMAQHGYSIKEILPKLLLHCSDAYRERHSFWKMISTCFNEAFAKQIALWCDENELCFTGHYAAEDTLRGQMSAVADVMRKYEWMHMPGIDHLGNRTTRPVLLKQVGSVARQLGKKQVLSEMFGCSGWSATIADFKYIADWHYSMGINVQCQHLAAYSLRGLRKRDYPPSISYQQPWWKDFKRFTHYSHGLQQWLHKGGEVSDILVLHPLTSAWCLEQREQGDALWELDRRFGEISELLLQMNINYDYGDELLLERYGSLERDRLKLGRMSYKAVVLPSLLSIEESTFAMLQQFKAAGGMIISVGQLPHLIGGEQCEELQQWCKQQVTRVMPTRKALEAVLGGLERRLRIYDKNGTANSSIYSYERRNDDETIYFLLQTTEASGWSGHMEVQGKCSVVRVNPETGEQAKQAVLHRGGNTICKMSLEARESAIICTLPLDAGVNDREHHASPIIQPEERSQSIMSPVWKLNAATANQLTLDSCQYRIAGHTDWSSKKNHLHIQEELSEWNQDLDIELRYEFDIEQDYNLLLPFKLALEDLDEVQIYCNRKPVQLERHEIWFDPAIKQISLESYIRKGRNELIIRREFRSGGKYVAYLENEDVFETEKNRFHQETELECLYLIGHFSVASKRGMKEIATGIYEAAADGFSLSALPEYIHAEDLTSQGLCFFAGTVEIEQVWICQTKPDQATLELKEPYAATVELYVNGQLAGRRGWAPYTFDMTSLIHKGNNDIQLRLTSGLRNLLGPHHHCKGDVGFVGPSIFKGKRGWEDHIYDYSPPDHTWRDEYYFISFGTGHSPVITLRCGSEE
ncbi:glycosyl hydrolase [Paenibacillus sp. J5C_2022]|uniref:glycosyl hydrolase n=1 Tax=Paenibacillus sp. J5C2022 TaxID=2977129 RepID=UPI0021CF967B|nr:glycosyl hydrolase [Paenibacillus sp. J5C2022]MCU6710935.1 glycosyl hydrolase [Paenibacillus sp. J5C2022]